MQTYQNIQVIWDDDHGSANQGWYLRTKADGQEEDMVIDALEDLGHEASDTELRDAAIDFLFDHPTDDQIASLHCDIQVLR